MPDAGIVFGLRVAGGCYNRFLINYHTYLFPKPANKKGFTSSNAHKPLVILVGGARFELATSTV